jgi:hypothetical protein
MNSRQVLCQIGRTRLMLPLDLLEVKCWDNDGSGVTKELEAVHGTDPEIHQTCN